MLLDVLKKNLVFKSLNRGKWQLRSYEEGIVS